MSKRISLIGIILLFLLSLCLLYRIAISAIDIEQLTNEKLSTANEKPLHIIVIAQEVDNPFWRLLEAGAVGAASQYPVKVDYIGPQRNNINEQIRLLEKAIASTPDGIIIQGISSEKYSALINKATDKGIPIITVDADVPSSERVAYIGTNHYDAGQALAQQLVSREKGRVKVGIIIGSKERENQQERLAGFKDIIVDYANIELVAIHSSNISRITAAEETVQMLTDYPAINTIVGLSSLDGLGIVDGLQHINREDIHVYAFDQLEDTLTFIRQNKIVATIAQQPELMGRHAIETMMMSLQKKHIEVEQYIETKVIDKDTLRGN